MENCWFPLRVGGLRKWGAEGGISRVDGWMDHQKGADGDRPQKHGSDVKAKGENSRLRRV